LRSAYLDNIGRDNNNTTNKTFSDIIVYKEPIPKITFDEIILNFALINNVFMSSNYDRVIIFYNNKKGVYYIKNKKELSKINNIFKFKIINVKIIIDYVKEMDTPEGKLYCEPRNKNFFINYGNLSSEELFYLSNKDINKKIAEIFGDGDEEEILELIEELKDSIDNGYFDEYD